MNAGNGKGREKTVHQQPKTSPTTSKTHKVGTLHHQHGATDVSSSSATSYGNMFTVGMVDRFPGTPHEINEVKISGPEMFAGYMVLDTGCQRTCCGLDWAHAHEVHLKEFGLHPKMLEFPDSFKFGKGTPSHSTMKGYYPSAIAHGGQPLVLAASTLNEQIPLLASNSLLTGLSAVFNLVNDSIVFTRLGGAKAEICRLGGHMALCISDFQVDEPSKLQVSQDLSNEVDWRCPPPEFVLSSQTREVSLSDVAYHLADDSTAAGLVEAMETADPAHQVPGEEHDREHAPSGQSGVDAPRCSTSTTTTLGAEGKSRNVQSCQMQEVRQCTREVGNMPPMRNEVDLEQGAQQMGGSSHERGGESWIKRSLFALAAFASTFLGNNSELFTGCSTGDLPGQTFGFAGKGQDSSFASTFRDGRTMDQLLRHELQPGAFDGVPVPGGLEHHGADNPPRNFYEEAFFNEEVYKPERMKMQQDADIKRWERLMELGVVSTEGDEIYDWEDGCRTSDLYGSEVNKGSTTTCG